MLDRSPPAGSAAGSGTTLSFRSPEVAVPIFGALSAALGKRHRFMISSPIGTNGGTAGRDVADAALGVIQKRRAALGRKPLSGLRRAYYLGAMAMKYAGLRARLAVSRPDAVFVWNGERSRGAALARSARELGVPTLIFEHAPIPGRMTIDASGVNAKSSVPRDPDFFRQWGASHPPVDWRQAGETLRARKARKPSSAAPAEIPHNYIFLPLQVATDTQILLNGRWVPSIREMLLAAIRQIDRLPEGWALVVKEHPSCRVKNADVLRDFAQPRLVVSAAEDTFALVRGARGVLTLNSSVGLQSFFFDKPVCVLGEAFYRQPGLVETADSETELGEQFSRAGDWQFDPALRGAFMSWLCEAYYVPIDERKPNEISERAVAMVRRLIEAQSAAAT